VTDAATMTLPGTFTDVMAIAPMSTAPPRTRIDLQPNDLRQGMGKLVLTVVELLRQLLEKQAQRRVESGELTDEEIERLGMTFLRLSEQMDDMKRVLGLDGEDLNLDLGPLGSLL
jgi:Gas vesicle protein K